MKTTAESLRFIFCNVRSHAGDIESDEQHTAPDLRVIFVFLESLRSDEWMVRNPISRPGLADRLTTGYRVETRWGAQALELRDLEEVSVPMRLFSDVFLPSAALRASIAWPGLPHHLSTIRWECK
jgi:hypothetical protein